MIMIKSCPTVQNNTTVVGGTKHVPCQTLMDFTWVENLPTSGSSGGHGDAIIHSV